MAFVAVGVDAPRTARNVPACRSTHCLAAPFFDRVKEIIIMPDSRRQLIISSSAATVATMIPRLVERP
jgi:hypothetical protein